MVDYKKCVFISAQFHNQKLIFFIIVHYLLHLYSVILLLIHTMDSIGMVLVTVYLLLKEPVYVGMVLCGLPRVLEVILSHIHTMVSTGMVWELLFSVRLVPVLL